jgi:alkanesulfonate monooxygenase SsuD/methylene tetrahydromethanopterin reductase-like flavin-dependent oxidoreductase (luciferase family)
VLARLGRADASDGTDRYELIDRFLAALEGHDLSVDPIGTPYGPQIPRVFPHVRGLRDRVWLGGGSQRSIRWAARRGLGLLLGNVTAGDGSQTFESAQRAQIDDYDAHYSGRSASVATERVIVPFDDATRTQREHYRAYAESRIERTKQADTLGGRTVIFQRDLIGSADEIIRRLRHDPSFDGRTRLRIALPYGFAEDEYVHILTAIRTRVLPELGWSPRPETSRAESEVAA